MPPLRPKERRRHHTHQAERQDRDGELEDRPEGEEHLHDEAERLVDLECGLERVVEERFEEGQRDREGREVRERDTPDEEQEPEVEGGNDGPLLFLLERRREEGPRLVHENREGEDEAAVDRQPEGHEERIRRREVDQLEVRVLVRIPDRLQEEFQDLVVVDESERDPGRDRERENRPQKPPAQLLQVIQEGHFAPRVTYGHSSW